MKAHQALRKSYPSHNLSASGVKAFVGKNVMLVSSSISIRRTSSHLQGWALSTALVDGWVEKANTCTDSALKSHFFLCEGEKKSEIHF